MPSRVTNLSRGARGFHTADGGTVLLEPGTSAALDLADHPVHGAWVKAGEASVTPDDDREAAASSRKAPGRSATARSRDT